jgi:hypothetical protein
MNNVTTQPASQLLLLHSKVEKRFGPTTIILYYPIIWYKRGSIQPFLQRHKGTLKSSKIKMKSTNIPSPLESYKEHKLRFF